MVKMVIHIKAGSFEISKLKNLENPETLLRSLEFVIHQNLEHEAITKPSQFQTWFKIEVSQISYSCRNVENRGTPNLLQRMLKKSQMY